MADSKHGKSTKQGRQRKHGQNLKYINENRHTKSHVRRIKKHLARYSTMDKVAVAALATHTAKLGSRFA